MPEAPDSTARTADPAVRPRRVPWELTRRTIAALFRNRVTGLAAEAAFFALLSLPPLVLGLVGTLRYLRGVIGEGTVQDVRAKLIDYAGQVLSQGTVDDYVKPLLDNVLSGGGAGLISIGFVLSLWSGSRALNVYVDTITISYGLGGKRGIIRTRMLSFSLYVVGVLTGSVALTLLLAGPHLASAAVPSARVVVAVLYWPVALLASIAFLATLYHAAVPVRTLWRRALPGASLAFLIWIGGSFLLRLYLNRTPGTSPYGVLGAPIAMMLWGYVTALAVLIGAALNAEIDRMWPTPSTERARHEAELKLEERRARAQERRNRAVERRLRLPIRRETRPTEEIRALRDVDAEDAAREARSRRVDDEAPQRPTTPIERPSPRTRSNADGDGDGGGAPASSAPGAGPRQRQWPRQWH